MPAPIEAFHEEYQDYRDRVRRAMTGAAGGAVLGLAGVYFENKIIGVAGGAIVLGEFFRAVMDDFRHDNELHRLNSLPTEGEV